VKHFLMRWTILLVCFISTTVFGQSNKNSVLEKLKKTDQLMGRGNPDIFQRGTVQNLNPDRKTLYNKKKQYYGQQKIIIPDDRVRVVIALRQDNMPCIVPNMNFFKAMPNVGNLALLENPVDPGIYIPKSNNGIERNLKIERNKPSN
jgi:hypothetical protein